MVEILVLHAKWTRQMRFVLNRDLLQKFGGLKQRVLNALIFSLVFGKTGLGKNFKASDVLVDAVPVIQYCVFRLKIINISSFFTSVWFLVSIRNGVLLWIQLQEETRTSRLVHHSPLPTNEISQRRWESRWEVIFTSMNESEGVLHLAQKSFEGNF